LSLGSVVGPNSNWVAFNILAAFNVKSLVALPVDELTVLISENLPPSRVSAPDLHVIGLSTALDIE
jgi:hypothetical protein